MEIGYFQYFQYLSLIVALTYYKSLKHFSLQLMIPILLLVCVIETLAANCFALGFKSNYQLYSGYLLLSTPLYFLLFRKIIQWNGRFKTIYDAVALGTILFSIFDLLYLEWGAFVTYSLIVVLILHIALSCILLLNLAMDETRPIRMIVEPYFWLAAGLLLFASGTVVLVGLQPYILENGFKIFGKPLYRIIVPMLNVVLYSCYSYVFFLCNKHQHKFQLS